MDGGGEARSRITSRLTRLMPVLTLIRSAGVSRMAWAVKGSKRALPPRPRLISSTPTRDAAWAGQVPVGPTSSEPWLIELPWCSHTLRPGSGAGSTGASVRRARSSVVSLCGSQISIVLRPSGRSVKVTVPGGPGRCSAVPVIMSKVMVLPSGTLAGPVRRPSTRSSYSRPSGPGRSQGSAWCAGRRARRCGAAAEDQPYAGGLGLDHGQLRVGALGAGPGGQSVRQHAVLGALQLQGARRRSAMMGVVIRWGQCASLPQLVRRW